MRRRAIMSVLGATALIAASVVGAASASADATAQPLNFGNVVIFDNVEQNVTVTADAGPVTFSDAVPTVLPVGGAQDQADDFGFVSRTCVGTIAAGATCTITVFFNPSAAGLRQATLSVDTTTPAATLLVALSGTGVRDATGTYYGLPTPQRALDTRRAGTPQVGPAATVSALVTGRFGIPAAAGVSAVVLNVTAVKTTSKGFLTAYPSGTTRPGTSSLNFPVGSTIANMVTVPVGADGRVSVYNDAGRLDVIVDVMGWYAKNDSVQAGSGMGAQFQSGGDPVRIYDSRDDPANSNQPLGNGDSLEFTDLWDSAVTADSIEGYAMTITAAQPTANGVFTAWAGCAAPVPATSNVNYVRGVNSPNMAIVPAGRQDPLTTCFSILNSGPGTVHLIVDLIGFYVTDDGGGMRFKPLAGPSPVRIFDTRNGTGTTAGKIATNTSRRGDATSTANLDSIYLVGNTTGVLPSSKTYLTVWSGDAGIVPEVSTLNLTAGVNRAVSTYAPLSFNDLNGQLSYQVYNNAGTTHVLFDAAGTLDIFPGQATAPAGPANVLTSELKVGGRTIPGLGRFADHRGTTARRS